MFYECLINHFSFNGISLSELYYIVALTELRVNCKRHFYLAWFLDKLVSGRELIGLMDCLDCLVAGPWAFIWWSLGKLVSQHLFTGVLKMLATLKLTSIFSDHSLIIFAIPCNTIQCFVLPCRSTQSQSICYYCLLKTKEKMKRKEEKKLLKPTWWCHPYWLILSISK